MFNLTVSVVPVSRLSIAKEKNVSKRSYEIAAEQLLSLGQASAPHSRDKIKPKKQVVTPAASAAVHKLWVWVRHPLK